MDLILSGDKSPAVSHIFILTLITFTLFIFGRRNEAFIY